MGEDSRSGAAFIDRYVHLKSKAAPPLKPETIRWAETLFACSVPTGQVGNLP